MTPDFRLVPLALEDAAALAAFEAAHSAYFERHVPPRPESHFAADTLRPILRDLLARPEDRLYLIRGPGDEIIGRINLTGLAEDAGGRSAEVGYRVGPTHAGRGLARAALAALIARAPGLDLDRLQARVPAHNPASIRVLEANGFTRSDAVPDIVELHGAPLSLLHYARAL